MVPPGVLEQHLRLPGLHGPLYTGELLHLGTREFELVGRHEDLLPGRRVDQDPLRRARFLLLALGLARQLDAVDVGARRRSEAPLDELLGLAPERVAGAELLRIDQDGKHPVQHPPLALVGEALRRAGGERPAEQLRRDRKAVALVLAEREDGAVRRDHREARVGGRIALVSDDRARRERLALVVRDARLALGDAAGREIEQERRLAGARNTDAYRVGTEARIAPAPRRDDRARDDVHEVQADEPRTDALL